MNISCSNNSSNYVNCNLCFALVFKKNLSRHMNSQRCKRSYNARKNKIETISNTQQGPNSILHQLLIQENLFLKEKITQLSAEFNFYKLSNFNIQKEINSHQNISFDILAPHIVHKEPINKNKSEILQTNTYHINFE